MSRAFDAVSWGHMKMHTFKWVRETHGDEAVKGLVRGGAAAGEHARERELERAAAHGEDVLCVGRLRADEVDLLGRRAVEAREGVRARTRGDPDDVELLPARGDLCVGLCWVEGRGGEAGGGDDGVHGGREVLEDDAEGDVDGLEAWTPVICVVNPGEDLDGLDEAGGG